ncbi:dynein heavy chain domain-containing protein 1 isoform X10 [Mauremys mutica]|uniref:dynein heavy chain domain-containing protein 1 isoform X10 n=1 Tax=Mauremys mutica TaxID=74926 RepID=UPI001D13D9BD|nr:dynein heavy chain domain-containing protein 1 isoform X10 [Mauremys mutica]
MQSSPTLPSLFPAAADPGVREPRSFQSAEHGWAWGVRQRLAAQLQETGRPDPQHLDALVAELVAVFAKVLQRSSRSAWLHLLDVLQLLSPFREQLRCREELLPYLESVCYQYHRSQALVSDLDVLGAMGQAFPRDHSELCAHPLSAHCRDPVPPANLLPVGSEPAFAGQPCPFVLEQEVEEPAAVFQPGPVSLQELQRCVGLVGMELAQDETQWKSSLGLMSLALGTEVPVKYCCAKLRLLPDPGREAAAPPPQVVEGEQGFSWQSLTGLRAAEIFVRNRHLGKINFVYLNIAPNRHFRPYDLVVVPKRQANSQHYVFSPFGVLHVHPEEGAEALTLGEWHREATLWQLLQCIPFFRHCLVRKAFACWWQNVKHLQLLRRQEALGKHLLLAVPHFGAALLHISRLLQELRSVHWLPQDDSKCYTFPELQRALAQENGRARGLLRRFLTLCSAILELVRDDTYKTVHGLQTQVQRYKLYVTKESLYKQRVHYRDLERRLKEAEFWMQRLGSLAQLVNLLTCQNLVSIVQEEVTAFISNVMKANGTMRKAVLRVHLVFDADSKLVPFPSSQELETSLLGALEAVVESVLQVTRTRKEKPVTQPEQSPGDTETLRSQDLAVVLCSPQPSALREADKEGPEALAPESPDELLQSLPAEVLCGQEPQLVHHLDLKVIRGLEVSGHRLRSQYPAPSREQLEQDLLSDSSIQEALASQRALLAEALSETQEICKQHTWVAEIHSFAHSWSPKQLELMKGWPAGKYVQRVVQLRAWAECVREVPSMVITCNRLLLVDCSSVQQEIVPLLDSVIKEILSLLLSETSQRSEILISQLGGVVQLYQSVSTDIFTIAKCSQKLEQYQGQMTELQERVEYVRALNEVIRQHFRSLSLDEENLENLLLDTWEAFVYQQQEASDFIVSRRLSIIAELVDSLQRARQELQELLTTATTGKFLDPSQSPRAMEQELRELHRRFQAMATRVAELCRSQRILTGERTDVSFVARSRGLIEAHEHVWRLLRTISEQITEWRCLAFSKFNTPLATEKMAEWQREASHMEESLPADHPILQACVHMITSFQQFLPLLQKLASPLMKSSCWREFFTAMGVKCPVNLQFTLGQLLSYPLLEHSNTILKIWSSERGRCRSLDVLRRLQKAWAERQFRLVNFILSVPYQAPLPDHARRPPSRRYRPPKQEYVSKDSGTFVLADTAELKALTEKSLLTLKNIILSPHAMELREEAESWTSILRGFVAENSGAGVSGVPSHRGLDEAVPPHHHLLVRSIFVFAYIWGFSGHLHPRHWALFDSFARRVLYSSSYTIELPSADSVFDLYPQPEDGKLDVFDGKYLSGRIKAVPVSFTILPQYERLLYVLDLLLGSRQPVLLAGEPGCGKSSYAELLIQPNHSYHRVAISPALGAGHVRRLLESHILSSMRDKALFTSLPGSRAPGARGRRSCYLLLLDDLHAAELDARRGSHPVVETLRQALSHQEVYGAESLELRHIPSAEFNCFGLVAAPAIGVHPLSPRFTRLCSILSLPSISRESLISIHSPLVLAWLEKFPLLARHSELATALVGATVDVYEAVKARFRPSPACSPYHFSYHHIGKVLRGLFLLRPCPGIHLTSPLEDPSAPKASKRGQPGISLSLTLSTRVIVRLWLHESLRTFCDPLLSERERQESGQLLLDVAASTFCTKRSVLRVITTSDRETQQRERARSVTEPAGKDAAMELGAESHEEPSSQSSSDGDCPDAFDPIDQAPALALDRPDAAGDPSGDSALAALEPEGAEATGMRRVASIQPSPALRPRFQEQHLAMGRRTSARRTTPLKSKRRPSTKKDNTKPLLPSHLLLLPGENVCNILFSRELAPASPSRESVYHERCWDAIQQQLSTFLPRGFVLCREVTQHLVRLLRVLCCPEGHGALLSLHLSTGRRSLVALAAHATASQLFELTGQAGEREVRELIRKASWQAGILDTRVVVLVHQGLGLGTMQKLVDLMREGTYPGLYTTEDTAHIVKELLQENQNIKRTMRPNMVLQRFYQFVRNNLHMLLLLDGRKGWAQGRGPLGYPTAMATALLTLPCSIDVYQPWSQESLVQVATKHLEDALSQQPLKSPVPASLQALENSLASVASAMALIHCSASCYATHLAPGMPLITPKTFLDFLDAFLMLSAQLQRQSRTQADRMKLALTKMQAVSEKQREHSRDIKYLQEKLRMAKEQVARCQRRAEREEVVQKQQEQDCQHREARIEILTQEQHLLEQSKESATRKMNTEYKAALAGLQVQDIEELRSYRLPPASILRVTDTLCMMFSKEPGWESAKQLLGQEDFYQELLFYPKDELPNDLFQELGQVVSDESFCAASLQSVSKAAAALCQWICAIYWYHRALRIWEPTLMQLQHCKAQIRAEKGRLGDRRLQAEKLKELSSGWSVELLQATEHQEALVRDLNHVLQEKEKADTVESSVAMHVANWTAAVERLEQHCSTAQGDALLCAAALSYMGAFPPPRRQELLEKWQDICARRQSSLGPDDVRRLLEKELPCPGPAPRGPALLPVRQDFRLLALLSSEREQRAWDRDQKPQDPAGRQAALLLHTDTHACSRCWPLLLDPDQQALTWLLMAQKAEEDESRLLAGSDTLSSAEESGSNEESPEKNLQVLLATDPRLEQNLLAAASAGLPILLLDFERSPCCPALLQLLQKETLLGEGGCTLHSESLGAVQVLPSFRLYLSTTLPLRALGKEMDHALLKGLTVIDLSLSQSALEDLLLEEVLHAERREAQTHWRMLQLSILQLEDKLEDTEEELLELISQPSRPLLEVEEEFLPLVQLLQAQLEGLRASHQHLLSLRQPHLAVQAQYRQVARLGAALHQALQQVCRLHPQYQYSTASCLAVARRALLATKRTDASKQEALAARLVELSKGLSRQLLAHAQPRLQEPHNLLLSFLGALAPLRLAGQLSPLDWLAFCQGLQAPAAEQLLQPAQAARPGWVRAAAWRECGLLECLPGFQGLRASLAEQAAQWQEYFRLPATVVGPALSPSHAHLSLFQRAVLWRIFRPEKLCSTLHDLSTCLLGRPIAEDASYSAATIYTCSQARLPLLFLTPPWGSPGAATHPLHWIRQMAQQRHCGGVVVVSLGSPGCMRHVGEALSTCPKQGHWLVLNNCHLQERWHPEVLAQLSKLQSPPEGGGKAPVPQLADVKGDEIHPKFRLWLIAAAGATGPVPGPVHRHAVTLFCEMPQELKSILLRSYSQLLGQPAWDAALPERGLALLVLHAVLLHRQHYGRLAQARLYPWSEAELFTGLRLQERLAKVVANPEEAMQELAGSILYGGYILDAGDAGAVQSLSQQCLGSASHLLPPRGVKTLLTALITDADPALAEEEVIADTRARMQQLPGPADPASCGLSEGLQQQLLESQSQSLLADLLRSQDLWQSPPRPSTPQEAPGQLVQQGLEVVQALQDALQQRGWEVGARGRLPGGRTRPKPRPLLRFLLEECGSFLALLQQVGQDLRCAQEQLKGRPCQSPRCATILRALERGRLPRPWLPYAPTGPQGPSSWLQTLKCRCHLLCEYLGAVAGQPVPLYHLSAFQYPRRLLLALLQEAARAEKQDLDHYHLDQQVMPPLRRTGQLAAPGKTPWAPDPPLLFQVLPGLLPPSSPPESGLYLTGLELRNALWDTRSALLQETLSAQPCLLPPVWVQAVREAWHPHRPNASLPQYSCPIYLGLPQQPVCLSSQRALMHLALPCKMPPALCAHRRVHIVSTLPGLE